jgi:glycosyltransferase involved in cell wall biosynthesis
MENQASTLISVIIPTKDRWTFLQETMGSLAAQTHSNWEAIIVDDGSGDKTENHVRNLGIQDPRFKYFARTTQPPGASSCRNIGFSLSRGDYVIFLDSDDLLDPDCLMNRLQAMSKQDVGFAVFMTRVFNTIPGDDDRLWNNFTDEPDLQRYLNQDIPWNTSGPIWSRKTLETIGPWDEECQSGQDWEFHVRALVTGIKYRKIAQIDSSWRNTRKDSMGSTWGNEENIRNRIYVMQKIEKLLKEKFLWNENLRKRIVGTYYRYAFQLTPSLRGAMKLWRKGLESGAIKAPEYWIIAASETIHRTVNNLHNQTIKKILGSQFGRTTHLKVKSHSLG